MITPSPEQPVPPLLALSRLPGLGPVRGRALVERHGGAEAAWRAAATADPGAAARARGDAERALARLALAAAAHQPPAAHACLTPDDPRYPAALHDLPDAPLALFALGDPAVWSRPAVAVVGTRRASRYGEQVAAELGRALARAGACVVSGMARGIDGVAHRAALEAGGRTVAVLGTGADVPYPTAHATLHAELVRHGLVLSERLPGARATRGAFPERNRLIAALADVTLVVEAGERSGALLTAGAALELGRTVAAVPGPIDAAASRGANALLRDGAVVIADVADALALVQLTPPPRRPAPEAGSDAAAVWRALADGALPLDDLVARSGLPVARCLAAVTDLELGGAVVCELTGEVARRIG